MKTKLLIYSLPALLFTVLLYGFSLQDFPRNNVQSSTNEIVQTNLDNNVVIPPTVLGSCPQTFTSQTSGTTSQLLTVSTVSSQVGWAAGVGPTVVRTTNGGTNWASATGTGITGDIYNIWAVDANVAFLTTSPGATFIYKTVNGGATWTQVFTQAGGFIDGIQMISPTEGYAMGDPVGGTWTILKTTDGGNTWARMATEPVQVGAEAGWNNSFLVLGNDIWFGTSNTRVYHSSNLGATWTFGATTGTLNSYAVHYNTIQLGLAGGTAMVKSVDGGTTYTPTSAPGTAGNLNGIEGDGSEWWAIRSGADIYYSINQGASWTSVFTQTGSIFQDIDYTVESGCPVGWVVGNTGVIVKMSPAFTKTLQLTVLIEGFVSCPPTTNVGDTVTVELRSGISPYPIIDVAKGKTDGNGNVTVSFTAAIADNTNYYIVIRHRNSIETWSMTGGINFPTGTTTLSYDFTTSASQAFGSNEVSKCGKFAIYGGDVNQDGVVNLTDIVLVLNNATNFVNGYVVTDLNGDNVTNLTDILIAYNNNVKFVGKIIPA